MHQYVELTYCSTQDMNLSEWSDFTVLGRNGRVVVSGRKHEKPWSLFLLTPQEDRMIREQVRPQCPHPLHLLSLDIQGSEVFATSCSKCDGIKLINLGKEAGAGQRRRAATSATQRVVQCDTEKVFKGKKFHHLCLGEEDALYAESNVDQVVQIKMAGKRFTKVSSTSVPKRGWFWGMCYVPAPYHLIVLSGANEIRAISCVSKKTLWKTSGEIDRKKINPRGLLFLPNHNALLAGDGANSRILVLDPGNGSHRQTIPLPDMEKVCSLRLIENQIVLMHGGTHDWKMSIYSVQ